jgi:hypothetical protein
MNTSWCSAHLSLQQLLMRLPADRKHIDVVGKILCMADKHAHGDAKTG